MLRPLRKAAYQYYQNVRLDRQDFERLIDMLRNEYELVKISVGDYEIDDASDLDQIDTDVLYRFAIEAGVKSAFGTIEYTKSLYVQLSEHSVCVCVNDAANHRLIGSAKQIGDFLKTRQSQMRRVSLGKCLFGLGVMTLNVLLYWKQLSKHSVAFLIYSLVMVIFIVAYIWFAPSFYKCRLCLYGSKNVRQWWRNNWEAILTGTVIAVTAGILLAILTLFVHK